MPDLPRSLVELQGDEGVRAAAAADPACLVDEGARSDAHDAVRDVVDREARPWEVGRGGRVCG